MERKKEAESQSSLISARPYCFPGPTTSIISFISDISERAKICDFLNLIILKKEKAKGKFGLGKYFCFFFLLQYTHLNLSILLYISSGSVKVVLNKLKRLKCIAIAI